MRKYVLALVTTVVLATNVGCLLPLYHPDPTKRAQQLLYTSEDLRSLLDDWERIWFLDQPSHLKPYRVHGGVL